MNEVIESSRRVTGRPFKVVYGPRRAGDPARLFANADKIRRALGWAPRHTELDGIVASVLRPHGDGDDDSGENEGEGLLGRHGTVPSFC